MADSAYKLYYWTACAGFTGRATCIMWLLDQAGASYTCVDKSEYPGQAFAPPMVAGGPNDVQISQTAAIMCTLGMELGLAPASGGCAVASQRLVRAARVSNGMREDMRRCQAASETVLLSSKSKKKE